MADLVCQYAEFERTRSGADGEIILEAPLCEAAPGKVDAHGFSVFCGAHASMIRECGVRTEDRICGFVTQRGEPEQICAGPAEWRSDDGILLCGAHKKVNEEQRLPREYRALSGTRQEAAEEAGG